MLLICLDVMGVVGRRRARGLAAARVPRRIEERVSRAVKGWRAAFRYSLSDDVRPRAFWRHSGRTGFDGWGR